MMPATQPARLERLIGVVLRGGVALSSTCLAIGLVLSLAGWTRTADALLNVGLVILIATPASRVVISVVEYALERDWVFVGLTSIVLLELVGSLIAALQ